MLSEIVRSERLTYRRAILADLAGLHALDNDPEVMRWINGGEPVTLDQFRDQLLPVYLDYAKDSGFGFWIIEVSGEFAGWVSLRPSGEPGRSTLGYRLKKSTWGKGYATEAARAMLALAFKDEELATVTATTYESNVASQRVLEKTGMTLSRRFRMTEAALAGSDTSINQGDVWDLDDLEYEITARDYLSTSSED